MPEPVNSFIKGKRVHHIFKGYGVVTHVTLLFIEIQGVGGNRYATRSHYLKHVTDEEFATAEVLNA